MEFTAYYSTIGGAYHEKKKRYLYDYYIDNIFKMICKFGSESDFKVIFCFYLISFKLLVNYSLIMSITFLRISNFIDIEVPSFN